jgi:hypothetical protein
MMDTAALAKQLGVTQAKLTSALDSIKPAQGTTPQPGDLAAKLAKALGLSQSKVQAALTATRPARPSGSQPPSGSQSGAPSSGSRSS